MKVEPQKEHRWLRKLVGEWTYETEALMGPDTPLEKAKGAISVRPLGEIWVLGEGTGEMPGGGPANTLITLGYDPKKKRFVGAWIGSMMTYMWPYDGELDAAGKVLTLNSEGPAMSGEGTAKYQDVIEVKGKDHWVLTARVRGKNGKWSQFMTTHHRRKK